jgi:carboxyl-terminal processing protease
MIARLRRLGLILGLAGLAACQTLPSVNENRVPDVVALQDGSPERAAMNGRIFDASVDLVARRFYDRTYNGVDFRTEADARRAEAVAQPDEVGFYRALNDTLGLLDDRHTIAVRPSVNRLRAQARLEEARVFGMALAAAISAETGQRRYLVTTLREDGPAADAGVRPGWRIATVDGEPFDPAVSYAGQPRRFVFIDADGGEHALDMEARLLPREVGVAHRRADGVLVLRFSAFDAASRDWMLARLAEAQADPPCAVIVDLRGNSGGRVDATAAILGAFFDRQVRFAYYNLGPVPRVARRTRTARTPWKGPAAVLQSDLSGSAAEVFAAAFQEYDRGPVLGQVSAGAVVGSIAYQLPDGGLLRVGVSEFRTGSGVVLEKRGVTPDLPVAPTYEDLANGRDVALEAAVNALLGGADQAACSSAR